MFEPLQSVYRGRYSIGSALLKIGDDIAKCIDGGDCGDPCAFMCRLRHDRPHETLHYTTNKNWCPRFITELVPELPFWSTADGSHWNYKVLAKWYILWCSTVTGLSPFYNTLYAFLIGDLLRYCGVHFHAYADDTQLYVSCTPSKIYHLPLRRWIAA